MTNNDVLIRLRYALELSNDQVRTLIAAGGSPLGPDQDLRTYLKPETDDDAVPVPDAVLDSFLDGLVLDRRGPPDPSRPPPPAVPLTNNSVLRRIRIALELKDTDVLGMLSEGGHRMSKSELSALFRRPDHRSYRACGDQVLRKFLRGLTFTLRPSSNSRAE